MAIDLTFAEAEGLHRADLDSFFEDDLGQGREDHQERHEEEDERKDEGELLGFEHLRIHRRRPGVQRAVQQLCEIALPEGLVVLEVAFDLLFLFALGGWIFEFDQQFIVLGEG